MQASGFREEVSGCRDAPRITQPLLKADEAGAPNPTDAAGVSGLGLRVEG